ncbi:MAG: ATP-grasp domain-containing protein [Acidobacteriia bacterium]|nr:ATP-grasp domain-containing protein [Terriglobia bacterium]
MIGAKLKIAVLYDVWGEEETPEVVEEKTPAKKKKKPKSKTRREKEDREEIFEALEKLGHEPFYQVLDGTPPCLTSLAKCGADLVFNLTESYAGDDTKEMNVAAYMDLMDIRYTGGGPHAHFLAQDKATAKKMFAFHGIKTPFFATAYRGRIEHAHDVEFPLIVKPVWEDGSIGINADAVVNSVKELMQRVEYIQNEFDSPALIEEYIEGREIYAAILGSYETAQPLPLVELDLSRLPEGTPKIASHDVKFEKDTPSYKLTKSHLVTDLDEETVAKLQKKGLAAYQAVKLRDYGRIDMRLTPKGEVYVIEANPNPWLSSKQEFMMAAKASGRSYTDLIGEIVELAMARYSAPASRTEGAS